jgi:uncharacterized membrane protein YhaH (DUF805 family)
MNYYLSVLTNYAQFNGRARRAEYWNFALFNGLVYVVLLGLSLLASAFGIALVVYCVAILIPSLAVSVRRMHDIGKSGWYLLVGLIPLVGAIWYLVLTCTAGEEGTNEHGPDPKAAEVFA